uniref:Uncharacterized protein n=1 Tax=Heterorhabditis bacteriophora TaxID=37862 RepID=A0A1I7WDD2_HETBA
MYQRTYWSRPLALLSKSSVFIKKLEIPNKSQLNIIVKYYY